MSASPTVRSRALPMLVMGVCSVYFLVPIWWLFVGATKTREQFTGTNPLWFADFALFDNIGELLEQIEGIFTVFGMWDGTVQSRSGATT